MEHGPGDSSVVALQDVTNHDFRVAKEFAVGSTTPGSTHSSMATTMSTG